MSDDFRTTTVIDLAGGAYRITRRFVELPATTGHVYSTQVLGDASPRNQCTMCVPFALPPPGAKQWPALERLTLHRPTDLGVSITTAVAEWIKAQAFVHRAGVSGNRTLEVEPHPSGQAVTYLLKYAMTEYEFDLAMLKWPECTTCGEVYAVHIDGRCSFELGSDFLSENPAALGNVKRMVEFNNALPGWLGECADGIYAMAVERLNGQQKTGAFTGDSAGRKFIPYVASVSTRIAGATSDGPSHPVSGEPGDHGDR